MVGASSDAVPRMECPCSSGWEIRLGTGTERALTAESRVPTGVSRPQALPQLPTQTASSSCNKPQHFWMPH